MESLTAIQEDTRKAIFKAGTNFKKSPKERLTKSYIQVRLESLELHWENFRKIHTDIVKTATAKETRENAYFKSDMFGETEEEYMDVRAEMLQKVEALQTCVSHQREAPQLQSVTEVKLPKIDIPKFSGNYNDWGTFRDLYTSLIHNNKLLSNVQKLHYLKCSTTGEAEQLLNHIQITERNYSVAWDVLNKRYNNKRIIINAILTRFFGQKRLTIESSKGIKELLDTTVECLNNLKNQDINIETWDPIIIHIIVNKLDPESHKLWEEDLVTLPALQLPELERLTSFLEGRFRVLEMVPSVQSKERSIKSKSFHISSSLTPECAYCKENHLIFNCKEFAKLEPEKRSEYVQNNRLCFNCLWPGHSVKFCRHQTTCRRCKRRHHSLLHGKRYNTETRNTVTVNTERQDTTTPQNILSHVSIQGKVTLLATALVNIQTSRGMQLVRALLDPCSQESFITEAAVKRLQLNLTSVQGQVTGVGKMSTPVNYATEIEISSRVENNFKLHCIAYVIKQVTDIMPVHKIDKEQWTQFRHLKLADPAFTTPGQIDLLLGVNVYTDVVMSGIIKGNPGTPIAQQTQLGWVISGGATTEVHGSQGNIISMHLNVSLDQMIQRFWESETLESKSKDTLTILEARAEEIYDKTLEREENGRYVVSLPFARDTPVLPEHSREIAMKRLKGLEKRLDKDEKLRQEYNKVLREYIDFQHMEPVDKENDQNKGVYLPHHAVVRDDRDTTKVRVVFDGSCEGHNGVSLNSELLVGPSLQEELRDIIMRWRTHKICFVADIVKMYRQIKVNKKDTDYQRILWRFDQDKEIQDFRLLTVTFGTACAPYLAIKTLRQVAKDEGKMYPLASKIINKDFYMDDVLSGCDDEDSAIEIQKQLTEILLKGGFVLQKWSSNSKKFIEEIDVEKRAKIKNLDMNRKNCIKTLGITWETNNDQLTVSQNKRENIRNSEEKLTKRKVLSEIASIFDPMGWLAPAVVTAKILMQRLWQRKLDWDKELPEDLKEEWIKFRDDLPVLSEIKIDRWIGSSKNSNVELHGFSDVSEKAYAAVVYVRILHEDESHAKLSLVTAKTKVAPIKQLTVPRLELCAATLLSKLLKHVMKILNIDENRTYA